MAKPTVALVGRPNVGKSTLFNRIVGGRDAIVSDQAGTTRDRHFGDAEWNGCRFWVVDTGGLVPDTDDSMDKAIARQVELAITEADAIVMLVDGREGRHPIDAAVAERLRKAGRPVVLAVNKLDNLGSATEHFDFFALGLGEPVPLSAISGKGSGDLLDAIVAALPVDAQADDVTAVNVAIVGRPNVGKSSLANRLLGEDRYVVASEAGTTRDATDSMLRYHGRDLRFVDTAGLRRRSRVDDDVEFYSTVRTRRAIERSDVCLLVVDATVGVHAQDLRIATEAWEAGAGLIAVVNKWDLIEEKDANTAARGEVLLAEKAPFLGDVPFVYVSALSGQRVRKILDLILEVADARQHRVPTAEVNRALEQLMSRNQPPQKQGEEVKLFYGSQIGEAPPVFAIVSNRPHDVPEHYQRYLLRGLRQAYGYKGVPIRLKLRRRNGTPR